MQFYINLCNIIKKAFIFIEILLEIDIFYIKIIYLFNNIYVLHNFELFRSLYTYIIIQHREDGQCKPLGPSINMLSSRPLTGKYYNS